MSRELARDMASYLYKGPVLRVKGDAKWERREDGAWYVLSFKINSFEALSEDTLLDATRRLRNLRDTDWANIKDIDSCIVANREEGDGLH
jgi:hypothetical protein